MSKLTYSDLIGVPFVAGGREQATGFDCFGLTKELFKRDGVDIGEYYCAIEDKEKINSTLRNAVSNTRWQEIDWRHGEEIPVPALVAIRFNSPPGVVNHTGVYIGDGKFIHTRDRIGVCVDSIFSFLWKKQIVAIYKYVGDDNGS